MKYSKNSIEVMAGLHRDLQMIFNAYINNARVDISLVRGIRTFEKQLKYFKEGNSKLDPRKDSNLKNAKHLRFPSYAVDIQVFGFFNDPKTGTKTKIDPYNTHSLCYIAGDICRFADSMFSKGLITHKLRWGGNWDMDGIIMEDQHFQDLCHFELVDNEHETFKQLSAKLGINDLPEYGPVMSGDDPQVKIKFDK